MNTLGRSKISGWKGRRANQVTIHVSGSALGLMIDELTGAYSRARQLHRERFP
jgi:hypothetical protein